MKFVPNGQLDNNAALVHVMAWWRTAENEFSEDYTIMNEGYQQLENPRVSVDIIIRAINDGKSTE